MDFIEQVTLELPRLSREDFAESDFTNRKKGLIVEAASIHVGLTNNHNLYTEEALTGALESWTSPYPKPVILNHDLTTDPIGRVMAAKMAKEADGTPYTALQVAITDPAAIEKIMDQRYLTGSVGGKAEEALCNICGSDWASASITTIPCRHARGKVYKGTQAHLVMKKVQFKEYSIVSAPADGRSGIRSIVSEEDIEEWVKPARVFSINMAEEEVFELTESENHNLLKGLRKKEATPLYLGLKGGFLSALAVSEAEEEETEDVLAVVEELSVDLATETEEEETVTEAGGGHLHSHFHEDGMHEHLHSHDHSGYDHNFNDHNSNPLPHAHEHTTNDPRRLMPGSAGPDQDDSVGDANDADPTNATEVDWDWADQTQHSDDDRDTAERGTRPIITTPVEGQERMHTHDVDPNTSIRPGAAAPNWTREEEQTTEETTSMDKESDSGELKETYEALELRHTELVTERDQLLNENARLKTALKRSLAERVIDTKIAFNLLEKEDREAQLEEHMGRSATSLADSLRDLATMNFKVSSPDYSKFPTIDQESQAISTTDDDKVALFVEPLVQELERGIDPEDIFVDALMGRRTL